MSSKNHPLFRLLKYSKNYQNKISIATIATIVNTIFDLAPSYLIGVAVDIVVLKEDSFIAQWGFTKSNPQKK